jgi:hypothetical protein
MFPVPGGTASSALSSSTSWKIACMYQQGDQMRSWKNRPKFLLSVAYNLGYFYSFQNNYPRYVNNHPIGEIWSPCMYVVWPVARSRSRFKCPSIFKPFFAEKRSKLPNLNQPNLI